MNLEMFAEEPEVVRVDDAISALDEFPSEAAFFSETTVSSTAAFPIRPTALAPGPPPAGASETLTMSLRDVHRAGVAFEWDEAVAMAQSLCRAFAAAQLLPRTAYDRTPSIAELSLARSEAVVIDAAGHVFASGDGPRTVTEAVQCIGATLSDLLPVTDPMCIRARVVSKAAASSPEYESLEALSHALTAYEFRDREDLIGRVFQRATRHDLPEATVTLSKTVAKTITKAPIQLPDLAASALAAWARTRPLLTSKALHVVAMCTIAACAVGIGGWVMWSRLSHPAATVVSATPRVEALPDEAAIPASAALVEPVRSEPLVAKAASRAVKRTEATVRRAVSNRGPVNKPALGTLPVDSGAKPDDLPSVPSPTGGALPAATVDAPPAVAPTASGVERGSVGSSRPREDRLPIGDRTYDRDNADVTPPSVMYNRKLSGILSTDSPGIRAEVLTIAVIVDEDGTVDSVKAVSPPRNIGESLVLLGALSSIKSVQFRPAMKDGVPVKYSLTVPIRVSPPIQ
jgi:hypothetical protein